MKNRNKKWAFSIGGLLAGLLCVLLYFNYSLVFNGFMLPDHPALTKLGTYYGFPQVFEVAWESEKIILFLGAESLQDFNYMYRYNLETNTLVKILPDFFVNHFRLSPDKKYIAIIGSKRAASLDSKLWVVSLETPSEIIGEKAFSSYSLGYLGWSLDGKALYFSRQCKSKTICISKFDLAAKTVSEVYKLKQKDDPLQNFEEIAPQQLLLTVRDRDIIRPYLVNLAAHQLKYIEVGNGDYGGFIKLRSRDWMVGTFADWNSTSGDRFIFVSDDLKCRKTVFNSLNVLDNYDVLETPQDLKFLFIDKHGGLYTLSLKEVIQPQTLDQFFTCDP
jgi:hypothetical protein